MLDLEQENLILVLVSREHLDQVTMAAESHAADAEKEKAIQAYAKVDLYVFIYLHGNLYVFTHLCAFLGVICLRLKVIRYKICADCFALICRFVLECFATPNTEHISQAILCTKGIG